MNCTVALLTLLFCASVATIFGLTWLAVDVHKDTYVLGSTLSSRVNGTPLQVASTSFYVEDNLLTVRWPTTVSSVEPQMTNQQSLSPAYGSQQAETTISLTLPEEVYTCSQTDLKKHGSRSLVPEDPW